MDVAARTQGLGHHGAARFYGIRMRLGTYVESADKARIDARARDGVARRGHRDGDGVFVEPGNRFFEEPRLLLAQLAPPLGRDLFIADAIARYVSAVSDDTDPARDAHSSKPQVGQAALFIAADDKVCVAVPSPIHGRIGHRHDLHAGGARCGNTERRILENDAALRVCSQLACCDEKDIGRGLSVLHPGVVSAHYRAERREPGRMPHRLQLEQGASVLVATPIGTPRAASARVNASAPDIAEASRKRASSKGLRCSR